MLYYPKFELFNKWRFYVNYMRNKSSQFTVYFQLVRKRTFSRWKISRVLRASRRKMKAERGLSINNPNESWLESKGTWFTYVLLIIIGHLVILSIPFFDTPTAWTLTNTFHNLVCYSFCLLFIWLMKKTALDGKLWNDDNLSNRNLLRNWWA